MNDTIDEQTLAAAAAYPDLKIVCLRCSPPASILGAEYRGHYDTEHGKPKVLPPVMVKWESG